MTILKENMFKNLKLLLKIKILKIINNIIIFINHKNYLNIICFKNFKSVYIKWNKQTKLNFIDFIKIKDLIFFRPNYNEYYVYNKYTLKPFKIYGVKINHPINEIDKNDKFIYFKINKNIILLSLLTLKKINLNDKWNGKITNVFFYNKFIKIKINESSFIYCDENFQVLKFKNFDYKIDFYLDFFEKFYRLKNDKYSLYFDKKFKKLINLHIKKYNSVDKFIENSNIIIIKFKLGYSLFNKHFKKIKLKNIYNENFIKEIKYLENILCVNLYYNHNLYYDINTLEILNFISKKIEIKEVKYIGNIFIFSDGRGYNHLYNSKNYKKIEIKSNITKNIREVKEFGNIINIYFQNKGKYEFILLDKFNFKNLNSTIGLKNYKILNVYEIKDIITIQTDKYGMFLFNKYSFKKISFGIKVKPVDKATRIINDDVLFAIQFNEKFYIIYDPNNFNEIFLEGVNNRKIIKIFLINNILILELDNNKHIYFNKNNFEKLHIKILDSYQKIYNTYVYGNIIKLDLYSKYIYIDKIRLVKIKFKGISQYNYNIEKIEELNNIYIIKLKIDKKCWIYDRISFKKITLKFTNKNEIIIDYFIINNYIILKLKNQNIVLNKLNLKKINFRKIKKNQKIMKIYKVQSILVLFLCNKTYLYYNIKTLKNKYNKILDNKNPIRYIQTDKIFRKIYLSNGRNKPYLINKFSENISNPESVTTYEYKNIILVKNNNLIDIYYIKKGCNIKISRIPTTEYIQDIINRNNILTIRIYKKKDSRCRITKIIFFNWINKKLLEFKKFNTNKIFNKFTRINQIYILNFEEKYFYHDFGKISIFNWIIY